MTGKNRISYRKKRNKDTASFVSIDEKEIEIIHPFHPHYLQKIKDYELKKMQHKDFIVYSYNGNRRIIPVEYTNLRQENDLFKHFSKGKAYFRLVDLLKIVEMIDRFEDRGRKGM